MLLYLVFYSGQIQREMIGSIISISSIENWYVLKIKRVNVKQSYK